MQARTEMSGASQVVQWVKNLPAMQDGFDPWVWKVPCKKAWQPILLFLPGKFHGQRILMGYSP